MMVEMGEAGAYFKTILVIAYRIFGKLEFGQMSLLIYKWVHIHIPIFIAIYNSLTSNEEE